MKLVEEGLCYCICDPITAASYYDYQGDQHALVFRPFSPEIPLSVAILQPAHRPASRLGAAFVELLSEEIERINQMFKPPL